LATVAPTADARTMTPKFSGVGPRRVSWIAARIVYDAPTKGETLDRKDTTKTKTETHNSWYN